MKAALQDIDTNHDDSTVASIGRQIPKSSLDRIHVVFPDIYIHTDIYPDIDGNGYAGDDDKGGSAH